MSGTFGGYNPFAARLGGQGSELVEGVYNTIRDNVGDSWDTDDESLNVADDKAAARLLAVGRAYVERYFQESNPRHLTGTLKRWEEILSIIPPAGDSMDDRRRRVAARILTNGAGDVGGISRLAKEAFYGWDTRVYYTPLDDAVSKWPGNAATYEPNSNEGYWYSTVMHLAVTYTRPSSVSDEERDARRRYADESLRDHVPAWCTYSISEGYGFRLDSPNLDLAVFDK